MSLKQLLKDWPDAPIVACKACGKKIIFVQTGTGTMVPLDPSHLYTLSATKLNWAGR